MDQKCNEQKCFVHGLSWLNLKVKLTCKCKFTKELSDYYHNNFIHVINGQEYVEALNKASITPTKTGEIMASMWEVIKPQTQQIDSCDKPDCK